MRNGLIAVRVSTKKQQDEGYSLASQLIACRKYAEQNGISVRPEDEYVEQGSGAARQRPVLERVLAAFKQGAATELIIFDIDRFTRDYVEGAVMLRQLQEIGVTVHEVSSNKALSDDFMELLPVHWRMMIAQIGRINILKGTKRGRNQKAREEHKLLAQGIPPYGYDKQGEKKDATFVVNAAEALVVRRIFESYASGVSVKAIADTLSAERVPSPADARGRLKKREFGQWSDNAVYAILKHSAYRGKFPQFKYETIPGTRKRRIRPESEWVFIPIPAIVSEELWTTAQSILEEGRVLSRRNTVHQYLLGRRIHCQCGYAMRATGVARPANHSGQQRPPSLYYVCIARIPGKHAQTCTAPRSRVRADIVDQHVWEWLSETLADHDKAIELLTGQYMEELDQRQVLEERKRGYMRELEAIKSEQDRVLTAYARQLIDIEQLEARNQEYKVRRASVQAKLDKVIEEEAALGNLPADVEEIDIYLSQLFKLLDEADKDFTKRRDMIDRLQIRTQILWKGQKMHLSISGRLGAACVPTDYASS